ncbi:MAG: hypothetical protein KGH60_04200 [Candidatus Micrarchaeota archaeon]|nr:hypothetical protein [Candidatus Micrarchaeota archaeon]
MVSLLEKLMLARAISFKDGNITMFNNRIIMAPAEFFEDLTGYLSDSPGDTYKVYHSAKESFKIVVSKDTRTYSFTVNDYLKWLTEIAESAGWGMLTWESLEKDAKSGIIKVENSPIAQGLKGKTKLPVDHIVRGFIAGAVCIAFKEDMDVIETECQALGATSCKFVLKRAAELATAPEAATQLKKP